MGLGYAIERIQAVLTRLTSDRLDDDESGHLRIALLDIDRARMVLQARLDQLGD